MKVMEKKDKLMTAILLQSYYPNRNICWFSINKKS